jgi:hypothetical protein
LIKEFLDKYSGLSSSLALHLAYGEAAQKKKVGNDDEGDEDDEN